MNKKIISVVVAVYNEQNVLEEFYRRSTSTMVGLSKYSYELLFVDDGSKDNSLAILKEIAKNDKKVKIVALSRNFGQESALLCGLEHAIGDAVVIMDADLQDPPELIPTMLDYWSNGNDIVYAKRKKRKGENFFKLITSKIFYRVQNFLSEIQMPVDTGYFRLCDRKVVEVIKKMPEKNKYLRGLFSWVGFKQCAVEFDREERLAGKTKYSIDKLFKLAKDAVIGFSSKPLKLVGGFGVVSILISILILLYSLISYFKGWAVEPGWTSIMVAISFFTGVQLLCLFVIAEYIANIYDNTKQRPEYIIKEIINITLES